MKILVLGSQGQLGRCLKDKFRDSKHEIIFSSRNEIDLSDLERTNIKISNINPDVLINAAAYTFVDEAEKEKDKAFLINETAVSNIASTCKKNNCWLIHISTDYLFDGTSSEPYKESDTPNPQCVYGSSKLAGEISIKNSNCKYIIIRTAWVFSEYGNNFVKTMLNLIKSKNEVSVVGDQCGNPTYAQGLAIAIIKTLEFLDNDKIIGIYHYVGSPSCTWAEFAQYIFDAAYKKSYINHKSMVKVITSSEYPTPVKRPVYSVLDTSNFETTFKHKSYDWSIGVDKVVDYLNANNKSF